MILWRLCLCLCLHLLPTTDSLLPRLASCRAGTATASSVPTTAWSVLAMKEETGGDDASTTTTLVQQESQNVPKSFRRGPQLRQKPRNRRPKYYWSRLPNLEWELREFWTHLGIIPKNKDQALCIPNEALLNYFGRHDIRAAIATHGGREELVVAMGKTIAIMPGKWKQAVAESWELQALLKNSTLGLDEQVPPSALLRPKESNDSATPSTSPITISNETVLPKWSHRLGRKHKGFWTQQTVIIELYDFLDQYQAQLGRPAVWMPRPQELTGRGRDDLKSSIRRFGGGRRIAQLAGLIPFREWNYFEGQYELLVLLKEYLDEYENFHGDGQSQQQRYQVFPLASEIKNRGHDRLYHLIQYYGGRSFLSSRLGMATVGLYARGRESVSWGDFSLEFAIRLCEFIRRDHMQAKPPIRNVIMCIPSEARLSRAGEEGAWLHGKIMAFGGYENVARRLYLGYRFN